MREGRAPQNLAVLRHLALNLLKSERTSKGGIKAKRKRRVGMTPISSRFSQ